MNLDELRSVQSKERQKDSLQNLRPSFYREVGDYIADLEAERDRAAERADDPFSSPEVSRLTDEIETARDVVEAIYERRMGKLVKQASLAAAGMPADDEGLTAEEQDLFEDLVDRIQSNKSRVLDTLEGADPDDGADESEPGSPAAADPASTADDHGTPVDDPAPVDDPVPPDRPPERSEDGDPGAPPTPPQEPAPDDRPPEDGAPDAASGVTPADVMGGGPSEADDQRPADRNGPSESETEGASSSDAGGSPTDTAAGPDDGSAREPDGAADTTGAVDRVTVKITRDVGSILGVDDREYTLARDDVVTLPEQNATPLVDQEAAERLE